MAVMDLVVRPGDRVTLAGSYVARTDGDWLDLALIRNLAYYTSDWKSPDSVRVIGLNVDAVPSDFGSDGDVVARRVRVTGAWRDDTVLAESQEIVRRRPYPELFPPVPGWGRYRGSDVQRMNAGLHHAPPEWLLRSSSPGNYDREGQPFSIARVIRVTPSFATWADGLPPGLLRVESVFAPAGVSVPHPG